MLLLLKYEVKKYNFLILVILNFVALLIGLFANQNLSEIMLFIAPLFITISTIMSNLFGDLTLKNDAFICSLPITRKEFIASKYILPIIILIFELAINLSILVTLNFIGIISTEIEFNYLYRMLITMLIMVSIIFPLFLSMRSIKFVGWFNIIIYGLILLSSKLMSLLQNFILDMTGHNIFALFSSSNNIYILLFIAICCYFFSYTITSKRYSHKDI